MDKRVLTLMVVLVALAYLAGRHFAPVRVTKSAKVDFTKDLIISELNRQLKMRSIQTDTVTTTVTKPDGTVKTRTRIKVRDLSIESVITESETKEKVLQKLDEKISVERGRGLLIGPMFGFSSKNFSAPLYGGFISRPWMGPIHAGIWGLTGQSFGVGGGILGAIEF